MLKVANFRYFAAK